MYHKDKPIAFKSSASALCNNLSIFDERDKGSLSYGMVHRSLVNVVTITLDGSAPSLAKQIVCKEPNGVPGFIMLLQVKWCQLPNRTVMVVTSHKGIQIYEPDGSLVIFWHSLPMTKPSGETLSACFARGICCVGDSYIAVGNHQGHILIFNIPGKGTSVTLAETLKQHSHPISDIFGKGEVMISGDDEGNVLVWKNSGHNFNVTTRIQGFKSPVTSLGILHQCIIVSYGSGHVRVYSAQHGVLHCEVTAHARWITAVDIAPKTGLVLTVSEDSFARVWKLKEGDIPELDLRHSEVVTDTQLCGGRFMDATGSSFCVTGYDVKEAFVFSQ